MKTTQKIQDAFTRIIERLAPFLIGLTVWVGSVLVLPGALYSFINSKIFSIDIGMLLIMLAVLLAYPFSRLKTILRSRAFIGVLTFLLILTLSAVVSTDPTLSWYSHPERGTGVFFLLVLFCGAMAASVVLAKKNCIRRALLYPIGIASALLGLSVIFGSSGLHILHNFIFDNSNGGGFLGNSSFTGTYLMGASFVLLYLFATARSRGSKIFILVLGFFTIFNPAVVDYGIFHNGIHGISSLIGDARGAVVSLGMGLILFFGLFLGLSAERNFKKWFGWGLVVVVICVTAVSLVLVSMEGSALHKSFAKSAGGNRFVFWHIATEAFQAHPLLGTGPETFRYSFEKYFDPRIMQPDYSFEIWVDKPHNMYFEWLTTTGILGLAAYLSMLGLIIFGATRVYRSTRDRWFLATVASFVFAYMVNNFFVFDTPTSYLLFAGIIAWVGAEEMKISKAPAINAPLSESGKTFVLRAIIGTLLVVGVLWIVIPEMKKLHAIATEAHYSIADRASQYQKTEATSPFGSGLTLAQRADVYYQWYENNLPMIAKRSAEDQQAVLTDLDALSSALEASFAKYPITIEGELALGRLASIKIAVENKLDDAALTQMKTAAEKTISLSPSNPQGYWLLGQAYVYEQKYDDALKVFQQALSLDLKVPQSYAVIVNLAKLTDNKKLLDTTMQKFNAAMAEFVSTDATSTVQ